MKVGIGSGKILLVGGYTILVHPNRALVLSVKNARIRAVARPNDAWEIKSRFGRWRGADPSKIPEELKFVRHAVLEARTEPHTIDIREEGLFSTGEKLGLGSSAAVTVAVIRALRDDLHPHEIFIRAYRAHSAAQGKIGSGFDIAAALFGSIVYRRPVDEQGRDFFVLPVRVPPELEVRLFNVKGKGTPTPVSARKVMNAVKEDKKARELFEELAHTNEEAISAFLSRDWPNFFEVLRKINVLRRRLGERAGVPIEPPELDPYRRELERLGYVTVLPGAGGYDAIVAVGLKSEVKKRPVKTEGIEEVPVWLRHGHIPTSRW